MYDKIKLGDRILNLRKSRWKQYKSNQNIYPNPYEKFICCRTQETLAEAISVERRAVSGWETGSNIPSLDNLVNICEILECNIDYLLGADELPEISPIAKASHYTGISPEIIRYGLDNPDYLDCLNYFMHPDNCSELFNSVTLTAWKEYNINKELDEIKDPLKSCIIDTFQKYQAFTSTTNYSKDTYKQFLISAIPKNKVSFSSNKLHDCFNIKECITLKRFKDLAISPNNPNSYEILIDYIVKYTYEMLNNKSLLEFQKNNLGKAFTRLFTNYLSE